MKIVINPKYVFLTDFINELPVRFALEGQTIYDERNVLKRYRVQGVDMVVKSFKIPILVNKIAYGFFRKSKAYRSYKYALEILKRDLNTPEPIAYIEEYKNGLLYRSFYISVYESDAVTLRDYMNGTVTNVDGMLRSFVRFVISLHRAGILHIDLSPGNILMTTNENGSNSFSLIDINRLHFKKISGQEALKNFERLAISEGVSTRLAEMYAEECSLDKGETVRWINKYSDLFFTKVAMKAAAKCIRRRHGWSSMLWGPLQKYIWLRWLRLHFYGSQDSGKLYEKERDLYVSYIKEGDLRQVLNRKYHYDR